MKVLKTLEVPTGKILVVEGQHGKLECLSLGDYGKDVNLNQHKKVEHTKLLPLTEKWVCTISTQYGCSMGCSFCDVPIVGSGRNATFDDLMGQIMTVTETHKEVRTTKRFNIHFARMGEPTWNFAVLDTAIVVKQALPYFHVHPVVSTMMPRVNRNLGTYIRMWCHIKNDYYDGEAGLQLSINSTSSEERHKMFGGNAMHLLDIASMMEDMPVPKGRKYTLNFAIADYTIDAPWLASLFNPEYYVCKLTPMHKTRTAIECDIKTKGDYTESYPYEEDEYNLKKAGFDVLTFIASREEDDSRITCGNAILSDKEVINGNET